MLYPVQKTAEGAVVYVEHLPSKGYKTFAAVSSEIEQKTPFVLVDDHTLETPFIRSIWMRRDVLTASTIRKTTGKYCRMAKRQSVPHVRG